MYTDKPRTVMPALLLAAALLFAVLWSKTPDDGKLMSGIKLVLALIAFFFAVWGAGELLQYAIDFIAYSRREINQAAYPMMLAGALKGASPDVVGIMARDGLIQVWGVMDEELEVSWEIQALPVGVKWEFAQAFVLRSRATYPDLWPVSRCDELLDENGQYWQNYERQGEAFTNLLILNRVAQPGVGNKSARLLIPWIRLADKFGVER